MTDFVEYLNTVDEAGLLKVKGLSKSIAERLIAARPFATSEDCLKVEGMSEKLLAKLLTASTEISPVEPVASTNDEAQPVIEKEVQSVVEEKPEPAPKRTSVWVKILRWVLILLILGGTVYAAIIYGVPYIYEKFLRPVENNTAQLSEVAALQAADAKRLGEEIVTLQNRVSTLESRADAVDKAIAAHDELLANLATMQAELQKNITDQDARLSAELSYQIDLQRAVNYLSRCRLYLSQSNFGLAREDALSARNLLSELLPAAHTEQTYALNEAINKLDLALANLPAYPVVAVYDIDIAWQYLADGLTTVAPIVNAPTTAPTTAPTETPVETTPVPELTPETTPTP